MIKNVLVVSDDRDMRISLKDRLAKYRDAFSVEFAADGRQALEYLEKQHVSLVVADLKLPRVHGFELLVTLGARFPDILVVIMTGQSPPDLEHLMQKVGAVAIAPKPFLIENLAETITTMLHRETEGGVLNNVSSAMFLQLIKMEQKTCTIRVEDRSTERVGVLFFSEGVLFDARVGGTQGQAAAHEILAWDSVDLSIQSDCAVRQRRITQDLQQIILETARRRDDWNSLQRASFPSSSNASSKLKGPHVCKRVPKKIEGALGICSGSAFVFQDDSWSERVRHISRHGEKTQLGKLVVGYIGRADPHDYVVLADDPATVLAVNPKCPRDQIIELLSG